MKPLLAKAVWEPLARDGLGFAMDVELLSEAGLTPAEAKTYLALLDLGRSTAGPIITQSGLQSSVVHLSLTNLVAKGFVSFIKQGKRNHYQAANPRHLVDFVSERKDRLQAALPALLARAESSRVRPDVTTFLGVRGIKSLLYDLLDAGGTAHHTFGSSRKSLMLGDEWWVRYHRKRAARGIHAKLLFNESLRPWHAEVKYPKSHVRYTRAGFEPLTETIIRHDKLGVIIWTDQPVGVLMDHAAIADSYEAFFSILWNAGTKT